MKRRAWLVAAKAHLRRAAVAMEKADVDQLSDDAGLTPMDAAKGRLIARHIGYVRDELDAYRETLTRADAVQRAIQEEYEIRDRADGRGWRWDGRP